MSENKINITGDKNTILQDITARDITIFSGAEIAPEIKAKKKNIAERIANLVQIISLKKEPNNSEEESFKIDESLFEDIDFNELISAIKNGNCVLFIGPEISVGENGNSIHEEFYKRIGQNKNRQYYEKEGFFMPKAEAKLINTSKDFYKDEFSNLNNQGDSILRKIAQIPFKLVVSLTPDDTLHQIYLNYNIKHNFSFYTGTRDENFVFNNETPTVYNALGSVRENGKYIYTHKQFKDYIKTDIEAKFPSEIEYKIKSEETTNYLFIGFDFNKWYYKLLMYELNLLPEIESYSLNTERINNLNADFLKKQFNITSVNANHTDFTSILLYKSKQSKLTKSLDETFVNNTLDIFLI